jgi:GT2 family glycosyltransferase
MSKVRITPPRTGCWSRRNPPRSTAQVGFGARKRSARPAARRSTSRKQGTKASNPFSAANQALQEWLYDYCESRASPPRFFASNNLGLAAERFRELGGFDTATLRFASEDCELCGHWRAGGGGMAYAPGARVFHYHSLDPWSFVGQHFAHGLAFCTHAANMAGYAYGRALGNG